MFPICRVHLRLLQIVIISLFCPLPTWAYDFNSVSEQHIIAGYRQLVNTTQILNKQTDDYCHEPPPNKSPRLKQDYINAFSAWQSIQHIRFGPIQYLSREHRFELWPDKRGSVSKHLQRLMSDNTLFMVDFDISGKSVAVQGFSTLERLLYVDAKQVFENKKRCNLMLAITDNLNEMSNNILADWIKGDSPYKYYFNTASEGNRIYESDTELAAKLLNNLYTQLELMLTKKLDRPLGSEINKANGKRAEAWRSQAALLALEHNLLAVKQLYNLTYEKQLSQPLAIKINKAFELASQSLKTIAMPLKQAVSNKEQRQQVLLFRQHLSQLKALIARDLAAELSLSLGFNSLDGD